MGTLEQGVQGTACIVLNLHHIYFQHKGIFSMNRRLTINISFQFDLSDKVAHEEHEI